MPMTLDEAFGDAAAAPKPKPPEGSPVAISGVQPPGTPATPLKQGRTFDEAFGAPKPAAQPLTARIKAAAKGAGSALNKAGNTLAAGLTKAENAIGYGEWYDQTNEIMTTYMKALESDGVHPDGTIDLLKQSLKGLYHASQVVGAPLTAAANIALIRPVQTGIAKLGQQVDKYAAEDAISANERRLATIEGRAPRQDMLPKIDWKIRHADVKRTVQDLQTASEALINAGLATVGGDELGIPRERPLGQARAALQDFKSSVEPKAPELKPVTMTIDKTMGFQGIKEKVLPALQALPSGSTRSAASLLDDMIPHATGYAKAFLKKLNEHIDPATPVRFKAQLEDTRGGNTWGQYFPGDHKIELSLKSPHLIHTMVHEMTHGVTIHIMDDMLTTDFKAEATKLGRGLTDNEKMHIAAKPKSPLLQELDKVIKEAEIRAAKAGLKYFYGLHADKGVIAEAMKATNPARAENMLAYASQTKRYEFIAELFSNAEFQEFLANSEKYASAGYKVKNLLNQFSVMISRHLGIEKYAGQQLLSQAMKVGSQLMKVQSEVKPKNRDFYDVIVGHTPEGETITKGDMDFALKHTESKREMLRAKNSLKVSIEQILRSVAPESLGPKALLAASVIGSRVTEMMQATSAWRHGSRTRLKFWRGRPDLVKEFIKGFERGVVFKDPTLNDMARRYREWNAKIAAQDKKITGLEYEERDNYLYHVFEDSEAVANYFNKKYGSKWGDPNFIKDRTFDLYEEAITAGFIPKFDNPEDIMLARQHASDLAAMHTGILRDMEKYDLATKQIKGSEKLITGIDKEGKATFTVQKIEGNKQPPNTTRWRAPNGEVYWLDNDANVLMQNAFRSKSLWSDIGIVGTGFRSMMAVKNLIVPIRLSLSLFHPLHVAGIDIAAGWARSTTGLLSGTTSPPKFLGELLKSGFGPVWSNPKMGWRVMQVWKGLIPKELLNDSDAEALKTMIEGSFTPEVSTQYRTNSRAKFMNALQDARADFRLRKPVGLAGDSARAVWHAPWALLSAVGAPIFEHWIPQLKAASYLKDAKNLLARNPELVEDDAKRIVALRKLSKSVDNRYGEMSYNNLFWKRWIKDVAVLNTLSLGWQLGFIREYGGGAIDVGQFLRGEDKLKMIQRGKLDRPIFVAAYTTLGAGVGGLMTWAMTGEFPNSLLDYIDPRTGGTDQNGNPNRVSTMFYSREFASLYKHIQNEGLVGGMSELVLNKGSGLFGLMHEWYSGVNSFGEEIRDPAGSAFQKLEETLAYTMSDLEPITMKSIQQQVAGDDTRGKVLSAMGFTPAPKYLTESRTQARIIDSYHKYEAPKQRPFDRVLYAKEYNELRRRYQSGEDYGELMDKMSEQYDLSAKDQRRLLRTLNSSLTGTERMFIQLPWQEQKKILDQATDEERDALLPHSNKEHLRGNYTPP